MPLPDCLKAFRCLSVVTRRSPGCVPSSSIKRPTVVCNSSAMDLRVAKDGVRDLVNNATIINDEIYIGLTHHHLIKRWGQHISYAYDDDNIHKPLYKMIRDYGYERFKIELIKDFPCISRKQLEIEELTYIKQYGTLNIRGNDNSKGRR